MIPTSIPKFARATSIAVLTGIAAWFAFGGASAGADAHAEFQQGSVAAGATITVTLDVPNERAAPAHTTTVRVQVAPGWQAPGCSAPAGWTCSAGSEVDFQMVGAIEQESFVFTLIAPTTPGRATFPVVQLYSTGEDVLWSNTAVLDVTAAPTPTVAPTTIAPGPSPTPTGGASGGASTPTSTVGGDPGTTVPGEVEHATTAPDGTSSATLTVTSSASSSAPDDSDPPIVAIVLAVIIVIGAIATTALVLIRRRRT